MRVAVIWDSSTDYTDYTDFVRNLANRLGTHQLIGATEPRGYAWLHLGSEAPVTG